jgi:zinc-ribbon domain
VSCAAFCRRPTLKVRCSHAMANWQCQSCGGENPDGTRFCGHCGTPLQTGEVAVVPNTISAPSAPSTIPTPDAGVTSTLRSFVSKQVADRLEESEGQLNEERRLVTAVFADISGFTPLGPTGQVLATRPRVMA